MKLENCVPWGRSRAEYIKIFSLSPGDLKKRILGCGDGPSSFNSESSGEIVSFDPIYNFTKEEIMKRVDETHYIIREEMEKNTEDFIWKEFSTLDELCSSRLNSMSLFLSDYDKGKREGRYIPGELPKLPFNDLEFDLALSSHFLFLYELGDDFHIESVIEMLRVAREVRIFPIVDLNGSTSKSLKPLLEELKNRKFSVKVQKCDYEFQKGANSMLVINRTQP